MPVNNNDIEFIKSHVNPDPVEYVVNSKIVDGLQKRYSQTKEQSEKEKIELDDYKRILTLRDKWSTVIIRWISGLLLFHVLIVFGMGFKFVDFKDNQYIIIGVILENFLQIVGMGYIVIKFLYPKGK